MEEAKDYKKYLKGLKEATSKKLVNPRKVLGMRGLKNIQGLLVGRSALKRKRGGDTPGLKDYVKKVDTKRISIGGSDAYKKALAASKAKALTKKSSKKL